MPEENSRISNSLKNAIDKIANEKRYLLTVGPDPDHSDTFVFPATDAQIRFLTTLSSFIEAKSVIQALPLVMRNLNLEDEDAVVAHFEKYGSCEVVEGPEDVVDSLTDNEAIADQIVAGLMEAK